MDVLVLKCNYKDTTPSNNNCEIRLPKKQKTEKQ